MFEKYSGWAARIRRAPEDGGTGGAAGADGAAGAGGAAGADGAAAAQSGSSPDGSSWDVGLPDDLRNALAPKKFKDMAALASSYVNLEKKVGADTIVPPKPDAPAAEWEAVYARLGRPEKPEMYNLRLADGAEPDKDLADWFRGAAHKAGLNPGQARAVFGDYHGMLSDQARQLDEADAAATAAALAALKQEWGAKFDANSALAARAVASALGEEALALGDLELADGSRLGDHPLIMKAFAGLGQQIGEDALLPGGDAGEGAGQFSAGAAGLQKQLNEIYNDNDSPYWNPAHKDHKKTVEKVRQLNAKLHPGDVAVM